MKSKNIMGACPLPLAPIFLAKLLMFSDTSCVLCLVLWNWTCLQPKQPNISKSVFCSMYEVQGIIISNLQGTTGLERMDF